ncbi:alpha/beta hydrolase family esterase [Sandaracinus amylolyticus]|uniref:alpha/beta hydrolase family esterase n=1 Tax=Sandaracinus amylolyticus TaxID=927083 RepID=UPI001F3CCD41|nr:hypothetical protein [Sandaracinus amylolyticus]UJR84400.1 Hypothetical protein I5071_64790 [Sandaracinus amylolyticus]
MRRLRLVVLALGLWTSACFGDLRGDPPGDARTDGGVPADARAGGDAGVESPDATVDEGPDASAPTPRGPTGPSAGCGALAADDSSDRWTLHELTVTGVAARFLAGGEDYGTQGGYDFEHRNYFVRLPRNYDPSRQYSLVISGGGCGASNGLSGSGGGSNPLADDQDYAVQVGLSYVYPDGAGACFQDGSADTPDLPYFDAVMAELDARYCFDRGQVFASGFSSGAWESYMLACARGGVLRAIGTQAGGLRSERPPCSGVPVAAFLTAGVNDGANPIENVDDRTGFDSGSRAARDAILEANGCVGTETEPYVTADAPADWNCVSYTGCPTAYPVVWCPITADDGRHGAGNPRAFWPFWSTLGAP